MKLNSLKSRILASITGIVLISLAGTTIFFEEKIKHELSAALEENALNLIGATRNHVESQYNSILYHKTATMDYKKQELKNHTAIASAILENTYQKYLSGELQQQQAKLQAISELRKLRYDDGIGYFWLLNTERPLPLMIMHAITPELENSYLKDPIYNSALGRNENLTKAMVDVCLQHGEGYVDYLWPKPTPEGISEQQPKLSYVRLFTPWEWIIGTGVYIDDIDIYVQKRINAVIEDLNKVILKQKIGQSGYFFIFDNRNTMLVHPSLAGRDISSLVNPLTGNSLVEEFKAAALTPESTLEYLWDKPDFPGEYRFPKRAWVTYYEPLGWYIASSIYKEDLEQKISAITRNIFLFSLTFIVTALLLALLIARSITRPLNTLVRAISRTDNEGLPIDTIPQTDISEIRALSTTINKMLDSIARSRDQIKQNEAKFRGLVESSSDLIWEVDQNAVYTYVSPQIETILGYRPEEIVGRRVFDLMTPAEAARVKPITSQLIATGKAIVSLENVKNHKDGHPVSIETSGVPIISDSGEISGYRGVNRDISERKRTEKERERLLHDLQERLKEMKLLYQVARDSTEVKALEEFLQRTVDSIPLAWHYPEITCARITLDDSAYQTENFKPTAWRQAADIVLNGESAGLIEVCYLQEMPQLDEGPFLKEERILIDTLAGNIISITERKQAEEELRHLRNYLSNIINSMPSMLIGVDADCRVTQWNLTAEEATSITAGSAYGKTLSEVLPQMTSEMQKITESIRSRETRRDQKMPRQSQHGTCYEDVTIYPLIANGVEGAVIRIDDVTDKVRMEEMMIQSEKMLSVGGLAAGMAHEINNPLAGIMQNIQVLRNRFKPDLKKNQEAALACGTTIEAIQAYMQERNLIGMLDNINQTSQRAAKVVENMLSFSRKSKGLPLPENLADLLDRTVDLAANDYDLKKNYDFRHIQIVRQYDPALPSVPCQASKIQQVILNLLKNGAQAMAEAGTESPRFTLRLKMQAGQAMIEVKDNGPGMPEEVRRRVFEPFFTTKEPGVGTGLGLSVSYFIITEDHNGSMQVESTPGRGTRFSIRLPLG